MLLDGRNTVSHKVLTAVSPTHPGCICLWLRSSSQVLGSSLNLRFSSANRKAAQEGKRETPGTRQH
ncbi:unnamed protein product [Nyctereutes procyonoides]|uniref:(raccoon dog) hypothetical protein n=1 Tax=Nyctereutes procyonoides TaxID=34880 RepID=A0A811ZLL6_NYCPR|nr:unnamed protein product [Nyctereutes procyonoides]